MLRGWLHLVSFFVTLVAGPILVAHAHTDGARAALTVYVVSLVALFGVSASFHRIRWSPAGRRRMRRADHATIFLAIAGTYTAVAGLTVHGWAQILVLCLVWFGGAIGIAVRQVWLDAPKWAIAVPYVVAGWSALAIIPQLVHGLGGVGFGLILAGGACYTDRCRLLRHEAAESRAGRLRIPRGVPRADRGGSHAALHRHRRVRAAQVVTDT